MIVRGWLIVGNVTGDVGRLPDADYRGDHAGALPNATNYLPGQWLLWRPVTGRASAWKMGATQMVVVCVEMPIKIGASGG